TVLLPKVFIAGRAVGCKQDDGLLHLLHQRTAGDHFVIGMSHQDQSDSQERLERICWHSICDAEFLGLAALLRISAESRRRPQVPLPLCGSLTISSLVVVQFDFFAEDKAGTLVILICVAQALLPVPECTS